MASEHPFVPHNASLTFSHPLFAESPRFHKLDVLAAKLRSATPNDHDTKGLLLTFEAKEGPEQEVAQFLCDAQLLVEQGPEMTACFAIHIDDGKYSIFDVLAEKLGERVIAARA